MHAGKGRLGARWVGAYTLTEATANDLVHVAVTDRGGAEGMGSVFVSPFRVYTAESILK